MNKNMFVLLSASDNESDAEVKVDEVLHTGTPVSKTRSNSCQSDWETDDAVEFEIEDNKEHIVKKSPKKKSGIVPFKGVECVPLCPVTEEDFPNLGVSSPTPSTSSSKSGKSRRQRKKNTKTFTIGSSYIDEKRRNNNHGRDQHRDDPRTAAFAKMGDKEAMAKSLTRTRACKNVTNCQENGEYGVCYRDTCSFAHSLEELNDPMCGFDTTCRFRHGRPRRGGTVDSEGKCMFRHSDETREGWLKRTGRKLPSLPSTSKKTRDPVARKENTHKEKRMTQPVQEKKALGSGYAAKTNLATPVTKITLTTPSTPRKIVWGKQVPQKVPETPVSIPLTPKRLEISSDSSSDSESDSRHYRKRSYRRRKRSHSPKTRRDNKSDTQIIRVPTQELAKMAIQAAFDRGVYNIKVLVE